MKASRSEFANRAMLFGLIFGVGFACQSFDPQNITAVFANRLKAEWGVRAQVTAHVLFGLAALLLGLGALLRTWASSYLKATVVYATEVRTEKLVADGPYRYLRNPLYLGNILMAIALGAMMSRSGFAVCVIATALFCYRLIFREEEDLTVTRGAAYNAYRKGVPRLWPALSARIPSAGGVAQWATGFKAESWFWGFFLAIAVFAITFNVKWFFALIAASLVLLWVSTSIMAKKA